MVLYINCCVREESRTHRLAAEVLRRLGGEVAELKLYEEYNELKVAIDHGSVEHHSEELGDLLFSAVNVSRFLGIDCEKALYEACDKYIKRFSMVEQLADERGIDMKTAELSQLDSLWEEVKIKQKKK